MTNVNDDVQIKKRKYDNDRDQDARWKRTLSAFELDDRISRQRRENELEEVKKNYPNDLVILSEITNVGFPREIIRLILLKWIPDSKEIHTLISNCLNQSRQFGTLMEIEQRKIHIHILCDLFRYRSSDIADSEIEWLLSRLLVHHDLKLLQLLYDCSQRIRDLNQTQVLNLLQRYLNFEYHCFDQKTVISILKWFRNKYPSIDHHKFFTTPFQESESPSSQWVDDRDDYYNNKFIRLLADNYLEICEWIMEEYQSTDWETVVSEALKRKKKLFPFFSVKVKENIKKLKPMLKTCLTFEYDDDANSSLDENTKIRIQKLLKFIKKIIKI